MILITLFPLCRRRRSWEIISHHTDSQMGRQNNQASWWQSWSSKMSSSCTNWSGSCFDWQVNTCINVKTIENGNKRLYLSFQVVIRFMLAYHFLQSILAFLTKNLITLENTWKIFKCLSWMKYPWLAMTSIMTFPKGVKKSSSIMMLLEEEQN